MRRPVVLELAVRVHDIVAEVGDLLRDRELGLAATERFLGIPSHGDVANESDEPRRVGALHSPDRQLRGELAAVPALGQQLATDADDARLAGFDVMTEVVVVLRAVRLRQQDVDLEADHLLFVVTEHALAGVIEQFDAAFVIEQDDGVDRGVQDRLEFSLQPMCALFLRLGDSQ